MTDTQIPKGPWVITPDAKLPFDLRISSASGAYIAKVYGEDAGPRRQLTMALASLPRMIEALDEISKGRGPFNRNPMVHAENTIEAMKALAVEALVQAGVRPCPGHIASDDDATRCRYCGTSSNEERPDEEEQG